jgi:hypothetical protein
MTALPSGTVTLQSRVPGATARNIALITVIEDNGRASYSAYAPDLAGVVATGEGTLEGCEAAIRLAGDLMP